MAARDIMPWQSPLGGHYEIEYGQMTASEVFEIGEPVGLVDAGTLTEPAGATALAGALHAAKEGRMAADAQVVCLVTGTGFKDEASIERMTADVECPLLDHADLQQMD